MLSTRPRRFRIHLLWGLMSVGLTASLVYLAGLAILPAEADGGAGQGAEERLPMVEDLSGSQAIAVVSGGHEANLVLDRVTVGEYNEDIEAGDPMRLSLTFRSNEASLLVTAAEITIDTPATGRSASAMLGFQGANYLGNDGECTVSLESIDHVVLEPMPAVRDGVPRGVPIPVYAGTLECRGVEAIGSDTYIDLYAVFRHLPEQ